MDTLFLRQNWSYIVLIQCRHQAVFSMCKFIVSPTQVHFFLSFPTSLDRCLFPVHSVVPSGFQAHKRKWVKSAMRSRKSMYGFESPVAKDHPPPPHPHFSPNQFEAETILTQVKGQGSSSQCLCLHRAVSMRDGDTQGHKAGLLLGSGERCGSTSTWDHNVNVS